MGEWVTVARAEGLAPGERRFIAVDDAQIAIFNFDGQYNAIEDVCTHEGDSSPAQHGPRPLTNRRVAVQFSL